MTKSITKVVCLLACIILVSISPTSAKVTHSKADQLKGTYTPVGAQKEGNADGTIPAWTGEGVKVPDGWQGPGHHLPNPFPEDKPLFVITAQNMDQYADKLTDGLKGMLKTFPDTFKLPIYKSRRPATYPDWYKENTYKNALNAELEDDGNGVANVVRGLPFPIPNSGIEALWNHILRYRGFARKSVVTEIVPDLKGNYVPDVIEMNRYFPFYDTTNSNEKKMLSGMRVLQMAPPRVAGDTYLLLDSINSIKQPRTAYRYFAGQRRVRRAPVLAYDTPIPTTRGLHTFDDFDMFYGAPDRFEWKLVGKKEMYIPYNCYELGSPNLTYKDIIGPGHFNPDHTRYELHRVWIVEGTLKEGQRHIYSRRVHYIDEDSWNTALADKYDERGDLWRCQVMYLAYCWDIPAIFKISHAQYDLISRTYYASPLQNEGTWWTFNKPFPKNFFTSASIRRGGVR